MQAQRNQELIEEEEYYEFVSTYSLDVRGREGRHSLFGEV